MPVLEQVSCPTCGKDNSSDALFCAKCITPLSIKKLADMDPDEFSLCAQALAETLDLPPDERAGHTTDIHTHGLLEQYLNLHWLRPETALWQTIEARAVSMWMKDFVHDPILDLGCGDGTHAAIMFGTTFDERFDVFYSLRHDADDIFNAFRNEEYRPRIRGTGRRIDWGIDIRETMVKRARTLGIFKEILVNDATSLSLPDAGVRTVYSNVLRDFPDETCEAALAEVARILRPGGHLILPACTPAWKDCMYFKPMARSLEAVGRSTEANKMSTLDRGRSVSFAQQIPRSRWENRLARYGLRIVAHQKTHAREVARFWDVGLRPFIVPLSKWANEMDPDARRMTKRDIVQTIRPILERFLAIEPGDDCAHVMYLVRKISGS